MNENRRKPTLETYYVRTQVVKNSLLGLECVPSRGISDKLCVVINLLTGGIGVLFGFHSK